MKCLNPNCGGEAKTRGICHKCYQSVRILVSKNKITWAELERLKKVLPIGKTGRPTGKAAWFTDGHINEPVESEKPCKYCGSDKGTWYRPTEPKGNFCQACGKCCDEEVTPDTKLDEVCEKIIEDNPLLWTTGQRQKLKQACLEAIALDRQTR